MIRSSESFIAPLASASRLLLSDRQKTAYTLGLALFEQLLLNEVGYRHAVIVFRRDNQQAPGQAHKAYCG
jgi:hypothetical protein